MEAIKILEWEIKSLQSQGEEERSTAKNCKKQLNQKKEELFILSEKPGNSKKPSKY